METLPAKNELHDEVGETKESPMHVSYYGWFMAEEAASLMSQSMEVGLAGFARPSGSIVGAAPEIEATSLP